MSSSLTKCVGCLPGQKDVDEAIQAIYTSSLVLDAESIRQPTSERSYHELQTMLSGAAADLNDAAGIVMSTARQSPSHLATTSKRYTTSFVHLIGVGRDMAAQVNPPILAGSPKFLSILSILNEFSVN